MKRYHLQRGTRTLELAWHGKGDSGRLETPAGSFEVRGHFQAGELTVHLGDRVFRVERLAPDRYRVNGRELALVIHSELEQRFAELGLGGPEAGCGRVEVPMPGKVIALEVAEGDHVHKGQGLIVVEAMKMENEIKAPCAGRIRRIAVWPGAQLEKGALLLEIDPS